MTTTPATLELRRKAEAADPMLVSGRASLKVMTEIIRAGFDAQRPIPRRKSDPEKDAAFLLAAAAAVVPLLDRLDALEGREAWQPIETAPRDGTPILATGGGVGDEVQIVEFYVAVGCWSTIDGALDDRDDESDGYNRPTHWRPLPAPPAPMGGENE